MKIEKAFILFSILAVMLTGCIMDPGKKTDHIINIDGNQCFLLNDSTGTPYYDCPIDDKDSTWNKKK